MLQNDFLAHPEYHGNSKAKETCRCNLSINNISGPINISLSMKLKISGRISEAKCDQPLKMTQYVSGSYPTYMEGLSHELAQCVYYIAYVWTGVHKEHQSPNQLSILGWIF